MWKKLIPAALLVLGLALFAFLIGKLGVDCSRLKGLPNVHLLGPHPYESLAGFAKGFTAAILPFKVNRLTQNVNPIKLREYLAAGLPVVSTALPEVQPSRTASGCVHAVG